MRACGVCVCASVVCVNDATHPSRQANGPGQLLQFNTDTSLSTYQSYSNAAELFAGTKYVFAVGQNAVTRFTVQ